MVRAPCCDKMGLKKGPWTAEEDQVLISFIQRNGHGNWRQLPKLAGLLRCGKSCRLRWTNYLRPDIKRGNFSKEEEETIIQLHEMLGNRWSAIASKLPGRTDNEIKNVWHTHLKKKLMSHQDSKKFSSEIKNDPIPSENPSFDSPQGSASELSTVTDSSVMKMAIKREEMDSFESKFPEIDESFWSEELAAEDSGMKCFEFPGIDEELQVLMLSSGSDDGMDFWYNIFTRAGELPVLPEF